MLESDGIDDVTVLVNSSPTKTMGVNFSYDNGFPSMNNAVLCAKASMLLQVSSVLVFNDSRISVEFENDTSTNIRC